MIPPVQQAMASEHTAPRISQRGLCVLALLIGLNSGVAANGVDDAAEILSDNGFDKVDASWREVAPPVPAGFSKIAGRELEHRKVWVQRLRPERLVPEESYLLRVVTDIGTGPGSASVIFRYPGWNQSYRTFTAEVAGGGGSVIELPFMAPAFTGLAEVRVSQGSNQPLLVKEVSLKKKSSNLKWTESITDRGASFVPAGYELVFNDEFNGAGLDRSKWFTRGMHANETIDHLTDEQQRYRDNGNHELSSGRLSLVARRTDSGYESGMIRSDWTARYGYFEARVKMPAARGVFPAFWLNPDVAPDGYQSWPPELDIFEFVNNGVEDTSDMLHTGVIDHPGRAKSEFLYVDPAFNRQWDYWRAPYAFDEAWHTIGAEWTESAFSTFVDGKKIVERAYQWRYADGRPAAKAHIVLNLAIGGAWAGRHGIEDAKFPVGFEVDWVRAYQRPGIEAAAPRITQ